MITTSLPAHRELSLPLRILISAIEEINIPPSRYEAAAKHYTGVGEFLNAKESLLHGFSPAIYPQGSVALGTAIKPLQGEDFDIDLACQLTYQDNFDPMVVRRLVAQRLKESADYKRMLNEEKSRCLRLDYSNGENFHLDIIAAKFAPETSPTGTSLLVPDRNIRNWTPSDPKGYIAWFEEQKKIRVMEKGLMRLSNVEPIPDQHELPHKAPLQVCIQLLKRNRDLVFKDKPKLAPISIIITTLAAKVYNHEAEVEDALMGIVQNLHNGFDATEPFYRVENPTNRGENFADKWQKHPELKDAFFAWLRNLRADVVTLSNSCDFQKSSILLEHLVGRASRDGAIRRHAVELNEGLAKGGLYAGASTMKISTFPSNDSIKIAPHTNFGGSF
ncbi:MAG: nucleotidyltransferase [Kiritimatiellae bacterium]|nr:nucleotidyltransferase [Kiritimatiellia bacterium]